MSYCNINNIFGVYDYMQINKWTKMRKAFGITDLVIGIMFFLMIISSDGGRENNGRMMGTSWFLLWCGGLQLIGLRRKGATIASIVFYTFGAMYNFACISQYPAHLVIVIIMTAFLILTAVSLDYDENFNK